MSKQPLVSICIPAYKAEKWIKQTIESALSQTWENKEIIVVDDGSNDSTLAIVNNFKSESIKVVSQKNNGACSARNLALTIAQGDYIQWLDADDILDPNKIEIQLLSSDLNPKSRMLHTSSWAFFYYCLSRSKLMRSPLWHDLNPFDWFKIHLGEGYMMPNHSWLVSRGLCELAGPWNERLKVNQDGEYFCRVVLASEFIKFHPEARCYYRKGNPYSISRRNRSLKELSYSNNLCVDHLLNFRNDNVSREIAIKFLRSFVSKFYDDNSEIIKENQKRITDLGGNPNIILESIKHKYFRKIFGKKITDFIKSMIWYNKIKIERLADDLFNMIGYK